MTWSVSELWRHPIKGIGAEALQRTSLLPDRPLPFDRAWAVLEEGGDTSSGWRSCRNFLRGAKGASLMAITCVLDGMSITLNHPNRPELCIDLSNPEDAQCLFDWLVPIYPDNRRPAATLVTAPPEGMSDIPFPSVAILNTASLRALSQKTGHDLDSRRFRGNIWVDGLAPWEEFDLVGKTLNIGTATLEVVQPITRCRATEANPDTGQRDVPTLQALEEGWGHTDFGVYARVVAAGDVEVGSRVVLA